MSYSKDPNSLKAVSYLHNDRASSLYHLFIVPRPQFLVRRHWITSLSVLHRMSVIYSVTVFLWDTTAMLLILICSRRSRSPWKAIWLAGLMSADVRLLLRVKGRHRCYQSSSPYIPLFLIDGREGACGCSCEFLSAEGRIYFSRLEIQMALSNVYSGQQLIFSLHQRFIFMLYLVPSPVFYLAKSTSKPFIYYNFSPYSHSSCLYYI